MKYIQGQNRSQTYLFPVSLDDAVEADNEVRLIDVFVGSLPSGRPSQALHLWLHEQDPFSAST